MTSTSPQRSEKIQIKLFADPSALPPLESFIPVFHGWIRDKKLDELLIDVADYAHVHEGPGVVLIGHEADYSIDHADGRPGLLYVRKRGLAESSAEQRLIDAIQRAQRARALLEDDPALSGIRFSNDELLIRVPDRLHATNTDECFAEYQPTVEHALQSSSLNLNALQRVGDPREPLTVRATSR